MRKLESPESQAGFTMIELALAILVFALGIMGVARMQTEAVKNSGFSMQMSDAVNLAEDRLETLTALDISESIPADLTVGAHAAEPVTVRGISYQISWVVSQLNTNPSRRIDLAVNWQEQTIPHSLSVNAIMGQE
jgi:prepilin-type N-terminal cleavage/methylation domain-containing protein